MSNLSKSPTQWLALFEWFELHPDEPFVLETESPRRAYAARFEFYRARSAALADEATAILLVNTAQREAVIDGSRLVLRRKAHAPLKNLLERALHGADTEQHPEGQRDE